MAIKNDNESIATVDEQTRQTTTVTVRVPLGTDSDIAADVRTRLSRPDIVGGVQIDELQELQPRLSATLVTVTVTVETTAPVPPDELETTLDDAPGVESVNE